MSFIKNAGAFIVLACAIVAALPSTVFGSLRLPPAGGVLLAAPFPSHDASMGGTGDLPLGPAAQALTRQGISWTRAVAAVALQSAVARTELIGKLEAAMGDDFAGVWFDNAAARLNVGVASSAGRRIAEELVAREGLADSVGLVPVRATWSQLVRAQRAWHDRLARLFAREQVETALSAKLNAVLVTLGSAVPASERAAIVRDAARSDVNVVVNGANEARFTIRRTAETRCLRFATTKKAYCGRPMTSGVEIRGGGRGCTAGPMALPTGARGRLEIYVLTAGHCIINAGGTGVVWKAFTENGAREEEIGRAAAGAIDNANGDYGEILITREGYWTEPALPNPVFAVTAEWALAEEERSHPVRNERKPAEGNLDCYEGADSGEGCGEIKRAFVEIAGVKGIAESLLTTGGIVEGDSGGPVMFIEENKEALMEGTIIGYIEPNNKRMTFEPVSTILEAFRQELLITANETSEEKARILPQPTGSEAVNDDQRQQRKAGRLRRQGSRLQNDQRGCELYEPQLRLRITHIGRMYRSWWSRFVQR